MCVLERHENGFRIQIPGRDSDIVNLSRLKPAFVSNDDEEDGDDPNDVTPPSPPPPGRPPGIRTRIPEPSTRVTRSAAQRQNHEPIRLPPADQPCSSRDVPGEPLPDSPPPPPTRRQPRRRPAEDVDLPVDPTGRVDCPDDPNLPSCPDAVGEAALADAFPHLPHPICRDPNDVDQPLAPSLPSRGREPAGPGQQEDAQRQGGARPRVLSFSNPKRGNFSYRRRKPDVSAIAKLIQDNLS